jgi:hypothetical protein
VRQIVPGVHQVDWGTDYVGTLWGGAPQPTSGPGKYHLVRNMAPIPGTYRNLRVHNDKDTATWDLRVNNVASALTGTSTGGVLSAAGTDVPVVLGDVLNYRRSGPDFFEVSNPPLTSVIEFESEDPNLSWFGCALDTGTGGAGAIGGQGRSGTIPSNTTSVVPVAGSVVRTLGYAYFDAVNATKGFRFTLYRTPVGGSAIAQDGTGGTPDTRVEIYATVATGYTYAYLDYDVPVVPGDYLDVLIEEINGAASLYTSGFSVVFRATTEGRWPLCGSNQIGGSFTAPSSWGAMKGDWTATQTGVGSKYNIGGRSTLYLTGLQSRYPSPGFAADVQLSLEQNFTDPANQPTVHQALNSQYVVDSDTSHVVTIAAGDTYATRGDIALTSGQQAHWSYVAFIDFPTTDPGGPRASARGIYVPTRGTGGAEGGGTAASFNDLSNRIIPVPVQNRAIYVPTRGDGGAEGGGANALLTDSGRVFTVPVQNRTVYVPPISRTIDVYDGEGYTHR